MKNTLTILALFVSVCANAQFIKNVDEHGNVSYTDDPGYDYSQDELDQSQIDAELNEIEAFLEERHRVAQRRRANSQHRRSTIGIGRDPSGLTQWIRYRKCRSLWRLGLKCL